MSTLALFETPSFIPWPASTDKQWLHKTQSIRLRIFYSGDDAEDLAYKNILHCLAQSTTPVQAAVKIDDWVATETNGRFHRFELGDGPFKLAAEEKDTLYPEGPNPSMQIEMLVGTIARVCSAYPPNHHGRISPTQPIQVFKKLPKALSIRPKI